MTTPKLHVFVLTALILASGVSRAQIAFPGDSWLRYDDPARYGWSPDKLAAARQFSEGVKVASYMIIENGYVVDAWGDTARRYRCHSVRKSFLSALVGIHIASGDIDPDSTIGELGIDDIEPLTPVEKSATVADLLKARSGIYHSAAYETAKMKARRPARGSHAPGTHYYYNNWDFNALAAIFQQQTGEDVFSALRDKIAVPLGMQDFRMTDTYYHLQANRSRFPAYPFMMSTRDAARFGLLYLSGGAWDGKQIVPGEWVEASKTAYSHGVRRHRGYGLLWWVSEDPELAEWDLYYAAGVGGQIIAVLPGKNLVIVQRVDTFLGHSVRHGSTLELIKRVVAAKTGKDSGDAVTALPFEAEEQVRNPVDDTVRRAISGTYSDDRGNIVATVDVDASDSLVASFDFEKKSRTLRGFNNGQRFHIVQRSDGQLEFENSRYPVGVKYRSNGQVSRITIKRPKRSVSLFRQSATVE